MKTLHYSILMSFLLISAVARGQSEVVDDDAPVVNGFITLHALVITGTGNPVGGARLTLTERFRESELAAAKEKGLRQPRKPYMRTVKADVNGKADIGKLPPYEFLVAVQGKGRTVNCIGLGNEVFEKWAIFVTGLMEAARGTVRDVDGKPIPHAIVTVSPEQKIGPYSVANAAETDEEGKFEVNINSYGPYEVRVEADFYSEVEKQMDIAKDAIEIVLHKDSSVAGVVVDAGSGAPVPEIGIMLWPEDPTQGRGYVVPSNIIGEFVFEKVSPGQYCLHLLGKAGEGFEWYIAEASPMKVVVKEGSDLKASLRLRKGRTIHGRVVDSATGSGVQGADVRAKIPDKNEDTSAITDAEGYYEIKGLRPMTYDLYVHNAPNYPWPDRTKMVPIVVTATTDAEAPVFQITGGLTICGRVACTANYPLEKAVITASGERSRSISGNADSEGNFALCGFVADETVTLSARLVDSQTIGNPQVFVSDDVDVVCGSSGTTIRKDILLYPSCQLTVQVQDLEGRPVSAQDVILQGKNGATGNARTDGNGCCVIPWLQAGMQRVFLKGEKSSAVEVKLDRDSTASTVKLVRHDNHQTTEERK